METYEINLADAGKVDAVNDAGQGLGKALAKDVHIEELSQDGAQLNEELLEADVNIAFDNEMAIDEMAPTISPD